MSVYRHLTLAEREYIMVQRAKGRSITAIAAALMRSKSTISRELKRNSDGNTYSASQAQARYQQRREACHRPRKLDDPVLHEQVKRLFLQQHWSPEQIQHRLRHEGAAHAISYATIYRGIYAGRFNDPDWVKSGKQRLRHRGKEFARHAAVAEELGVKIYFPPPYQPWQRGTNENTNGLLRKYCPKHQDIAQYSDEYIEKAVRALNSRPRKCLQWKTPYEVHFEEVLHLDCKFAV